MQRLDRDIYNYVQTLEVDSRHLTAKSVYDSIKSSNSSLGRKKKKHLEDSIERVLDMRQRERQADEENDSDAVMETAEELTTKAAGMAYEQDAFLLNRKLAKSWGFSGNSLASTAAGTPSASALASAGEVVDHSAYPKVLTDRQTNGEPKPKRRRTKLVDRSPPKEINIRDVAGQDKVMDKLLDAVWSPLRDGEVYAKMGGRFDSGVLLHGPSGCGKTMLASALAASIGVSFIPVSAQSLVSGTSGESEKNIRDIFDEAIQLAPALIFIDEIDSIAGKRDNAQKGMEGRIVAEITDGMDKISRKTPLGKNVVVLAATNRPEALDPVVRRRFDVEVEMGMPNQEAREKILRAMTRNLPVAEDVDFTVLAKLTPGYVGSDLRNVVKAAMAELVRARRDALVNVAVSQTSIDNDAEPAVRKWLLLEDYRNNGPVEEDVQVNFEHFQAAIKKVQPASRREGFSTIPDTTWADVGAMDTVRRQLETSIIGPIQHPERYAKVGIKPAAGILLWGPPGCGKTLVAKAVANESKANFISIKGPELLNKYVGESERAVRQLFSRAKGSAPCVLFFDEMDALVPKRDDSQSNAGARVVNTLLTELDGVEDRSGIYVIGATNRPDIIDEAIRRPGRLGTCIYVGLPSPEDRVEILKTLYRNTMNQGAEKGQDMDQELGAVALDRRCEGFSGADLGNLMQAAAQACLERCTTEEPALVMADWQKALDKVKPSVKDIEKYHDLSA